VHEHDRRAAADLFIVELHAIVGGRKRHRFSPVRLDISSYGGQCLLDVTVSP
jgi:hypothetical protein